MIVLALDTCDARGGVVVCRDGAVLATREHEGKVEYSEWVLPAVDEALRQTRIRMEAVDVFAVATGPGSFTGLRVGLATVKAWAEVYRKPVTGVSKLEAMARMGTGDVGGLMAACFDAQRGEVFGAVYRSANWRLERIGDECVLAPEKFVELVGKAAGSERVTWVSLDPQMITGVEEWKERVTRGDRMRMCEEPPVLRIAEIAEERAGRGEFTDALALDANYVRRSDAEIFWKGVKSGR